MPTGEPYRLLQGTTPSLVQRCSTCRPRSTPAAGALAEAHAGGRPGPPGCSTASVDDLDPRSAWDSLHGPTACIRVEQERLRDAMSWAQRAAAGAQGDLVTGLVRRPDLPRHRRTSGLGVPGLGPGTSKPSTPAPRRAWRPLEETVRPLGTLAYPPVDGPRPRSGTPPRVRLCRSMLARTGVRPRPLSTSLRRCLINQGRLDGRRNPALADGLRVLRASGAVLRSWPRARSSLARLHLSQGCRPTRPPAELGAAVAVRLPGLGKATTALEASLVQVEFWSPGGPAGGGASDDRRRRARPRAPRRLPPFRASASSADWVPTRSVPPSEVFARPRSARERWRQTRGRSEAAWCSAACSAASIVLSAASGGLPDHGVRLDEGGLQRRGGLPRARSAPPGRRGVPRPLVVTPERRGTAPARISPWARN